MNEQPPITAVSGGERRATPRFECDGITIVCSLPETQEEPFEAMLVDISMNGVAVVIPRRLVQGTPVLLRIRGGFGSLMFDCPSRVIHCRRQPVGWIAGCEFRKALTAEQVRSIRVLVGPPTLNKTVRPPHPSRI